MFTYIHTHELLYTYVQAYIHSYEHTYTSTYLVNACLAKVMNIIKKAETPKSASFKTRRIYSDLIML